ncbi:glycosyltransferase involved in cell wall biosynthesis [Sporosarcina luteola]|nr:glycosyltransferase involved in cell wall biosynthesis [Sporosarcina luteola]
MDCIYNEEGREAVIETLVSVVLTNYNYNQYLHEAIDSVLNQTYENFELVIVDDGSTDDSKEIIQSYYLKYPNKIKVIFKENGGQGSAFNAGIENANGEIIAFLDADDFWYPRKLEVIVPYHLKYKGVQHNLLINGKYKYVFLRDGTNTRNAFLNDGFTGTIPTSGLSYSRDELRKNILPVPEEDYIICSDAYIRSQFLIHNDIFSIDQALGYYRAHSTNQFFNNKNRHLNTVLQATNDALKKYNEQYGCELPLHEDHVLIYTQRMYNSLQVSPNDKRNYVIYGTGYAGNYYYEQLKESGQIVAFVSTFPNNDSFNGLPLWDIEKLKEYRNKYSFILIASQQMAEIYETLLEHGIEESKIIHPRM